MNYQEFVTSRVKWLATPQLDLAHSAMGLLGECVEYSEAFLPSNRIEELGDLEFYTEHADQVIAKLSTQYPITVISIDRDEARMLERDSLYWITHWSAEYHDFAKKAFIYNKPLEGLVDKMNAAIVRIKVCLHFLANRAGHTRDEIQQMNQAKLELRYPTGYSDQAAQARADKVEA